MQITEALEAAKVVGTGFKEDVAVLVVMDEGVTIAKASGYHLLKEMGSQPFFGQVANPLSGASMI